jgi:hypothetical protein
MTPTAPIRPARPTLSVCPGHFAPDEFVRLLECCYGSYVNHPNPTGVGMPLSRPVCHNPIERPEDRHHCEFCGGNYCSVHAERAAHECESLR